MTHHLKDACRKLRLSGLAGSLDLRLTEATSNQLCSVPRISRGFFPNVYVVNREAVAR
jgi:hypothetical protein